MTWATPRLTGCCKHNPNILKTGGLLAFLQSESEGPLLSRESESYVWLGISQLKGPIKPVLFEVFKTSFFINLAIGATFCRTELTDSSVWYFLQFLKQRT